MERDQRADRAQVQACRPQEDRDVRDIGADRAEQEGVDDRGPDDPAGYGAGGGVGQRTITFVVVAPLAASWVWVVAA
ncbi:MAG TPA: hypothetical protein VFK35_06315 [Candidatus Limnocylindrales bacterium]|nr:hypothetical protein [Candidatus Limnocylindrales bacterium]